ncbi:MAG: ECF transporter S component [Bacillales bacterium]
MKFNKNVTFVNKIVIYALLIALIFILTFTPLCFITIGPISLTTMHVVVLLGAVLFNIEGGLILGFTFGLASLLKALSYPNTFDYLFVNPFVSILPRVLFGLIAGLVFKFSKNKLNNVVNYISLYILSGVLTFIHSLMTLSCLYIFGILDIFKISKALGLTEMIDGFVSQNNITNLFVYLGIIFGLIFLNIIAEIIISIILVPNGYIIAKKINPILIKENNKK